jgi:hypothetical protein
MRFVALALALAIAPVAAQTKKPAELPKLKPIICDPAGLLPGCTPQGSSAPTGKSNGTLNDLLSADMQKLATFISQGFADAEALSVAVPTIQDGNGNTCWKTIGAAATVLQQHPLTDHITEGPFDLEYVRIIGLLANQVCTNAACTQVFNEASNMASAIAPLPVALPSITSLCAKVPTIALVAPNATPVTAGATSLPASSPATTTAPAAPQ